MDPRAKQRLTGAVILVALFVLLVPELLTGPRSAGGDAPSEEGMRRYTIDLDAPPGGAQPMAPAAQAVELPPMADNSARAMPGEAAQPAAAQAEPANPARDVPASSAPARAGAAPPPSSAPSPVAAQAPAASGPAAVAAKPVNPPPAHVEPARTPAPQASAPATARGSFAVQLGSFVSRENAERLVREMTGKGFNAFLAPPIKTGGRELYRVRVGPTRDRAAAEALAVQLRRIGQQGSIVSIS